MIAWYSARGSRLWTSSVQPGAARRFHESLAD
jgi:hypothetical protein